MPFPRRIQSIAVLGAGVMGAQIAAHFANAGFPVLLLDVTPEASRQGLELARRRRPDPFFTTDGHLKIQTGGFDQQLSGIAKTDWIIEAVVERLEIKHALLERVDEVRRPGTLVTSNTSGLSISALARDRTPDFRRHWSGTHFFNPVRHLSLLEVVPTTETDPAVIAGLAAFADHRLGRNVVVAKDTPGFIANHLAIFGLLRIFEALASGDYTVEEIDALTGPSIGRPKTATFRTVDLAGLDLLVQVAADLAARLPDRAAQFRFPPFVGEMVSRGWIGDKAGRGFYERRTGTSGQTEIWTLDVQTLTYRPRRPASFPSLELHPTAPLPERLSGLFRAADRAGEFMRATLPPLLRYAARTAPEIAHSTDDVDRAMRWGYGWPLGPFELWDAIGLDSTRMRAGPLPPAAPELEIMRTACERSRVIASNTGASLVDLGDGVLGLSFHSKMNALGPDAIEMLARGADEASMNFTAMVVAGEGPHFSAGANLMLLLLEAREGNWEEVDAMVRTFQKATTGLRCCGVPVVVAPAGLTLGGGCEIALHADRAQASVETYIGLVETAVGLIPAGGGTKEMLLRQGAAAAFELIGAAKVSTSAEDARRLGLLREVDGTTMNRDRLLHEAKCVALGRARSGYLAPPSNRTIPVGGDSLRATLDLGVHLAWRGGRISDHDALVGRKLSWVLAGGSLTHAATVSEDHLLDLEREAFLSLCGEPKTLDRIQHTLSTGKSLRN